MIPLRQQESSKQHIQRNIWLTKPFVIGRKNSWKLAAFWICCDLDVKGAQLLTGRWFKLRLLSPRILPLLFAKSLRRLALRDPQCYVFYNMKTITNFVLFHFMNLVMILTTVCNFLTLWPPDVNRMWIGTSILSSLMRQAFSLIVLWENITAITNLVKIRTSHSLFHYDHHHLLRGLLSLSTGCLHFTFLMKLWMFHAIKAFWRNMLFLIY